MITREQILHIASLAKLRFNEAELQKFEGEFNRIIDYIDHLSEVDTEGVEPMASVLEEKGSFRPDAPGESLSQEEALRNAPARREGFFSVPKVLGGDEEE